MLLKVIGIRYMNITCRKLIHVGLVFRDKANILFFNYLPRWRRRYGDRFKDICLFTYPIVSTF